MKFYLENRIIQQTINTIKEIWPKKEIVMAFQPHRYSRTKALFNEFVDVLSKIEELTPEYDVILKDLISILHKISLEQVLSP